MFFVESSEGVTSESSDRSVAGVGSRGEGAVLKKRGTVLSYGRIVVLALMLLFLFISAGMQTQLIPHIDNYFISMVANGCYGRDAYCLFISPLLSGVISFLSDRDPTVDWFAAFSRVVALLGLVWVALCCYWSRLKTVGFLAVCLALVFVVMDAQLFNCNFTISSALFAAVSWLSLSVCLRCGYFRSSFALGLISLIAALFFFFASLMLRWECALLALPFLVIDLAPFVLRNGKPCIDKQLLCRPFGRRLGAVLLGGGLLVLLTSVSVYELSHLDGYEEAIRYNSARSSIVDYPHKDYSEVSSELPWLSENDYALLLSWFFADTDFFDTNNMELIADACRSAAPGVDSAPALINRVAKILGNEGGSWLVLICIAGLLLAIRMDGTFRLKALVCAALGLAILAYYAYLGRLPYRIIVSVYLFVLTFFLSDILRDGDRGEVGAGRGRFLLASGSGLLIGFALIVLASLPAWVESYGAQHVKIDDQVGAVERVEFYDRVRDVDDAFLLWDSSAYVNAYRYRGIMPSADCISHNAPTGTWLYGQPYYNDFLAQRKAPNPAKALLERPNTYYVAEDPTRLLLFLREHYGPDLQAIQVGSVCDCPIWEFVS